LARCSSDQSVDWSNVFRFDFREVAKVLYLRPAMFENGSGSGINLGDTRTLPAESF
jgi:hypothetical protein